MSNLVKLKHPNATVSIAKKPASAGFVVLCRIDDLRLK